MKRREFLGLLSAAPVWARYRSNGPEMWWADFRKMETGSSILVGQWWVWRGDKWLIVPCCLSESEDCPSLRELVKTKGRESALFYYEQNAQS